MESAITFAIVYILVFTMVMAPFAALIYYRKWRSGRDAARMIARLMEENRSRKWNVHLELASFPNTVCWCSDCYPAYGELD